MAAAQQAVSGALSFGIGELGVAMGLSHNLAFKTVAHGISGGIQSAVSGGSFGAGALGGALGNVAGHFGGNDILHRTAYAAAAAGVTSAAFGGDFWTGARSGAYNQLYNWSLHEGLEALKRAFSRLVPRYGNFGGPDWTGGPDGEQQPADYMDLLFSKHDDAYASGDYKQGDEDLVRALNRLGETPATWGGEGMMYGFAYRATAIRVFELKLKYYSY